MTTDLQARLCHIEARADEIKRKYTQDKVPADGSDDVAVLCYLISYLAKILGKHLQTGEQ